MEIEVPSESSPVVFKTLDEKLVTVTKDFRNFSLMLNDLLELGINHENPIDLLEIHSTVLEQIKSFVKKLVENDNIFKGLMPKETFDDEPWNEFTCANYSVFDNWLASTNSNLLIQMANAGQFLQMKAIVHPVLAVLAERAKQLNGRGELLNFLNELEDDDDEMRSQLEKMLRLRPDF
ncbi:hypothetical protein M3Y97_00987100 [Aphelenchoides bicaudatus]|nr:hypothetical protein M3Y97_00987100 [Aphelenchoides bicaudatus]